MYRRLQMIKKVLLISINLICIILCLYFSISAYVTYHEDYIKVPVASHQLFQRTRIEEEDIEMIEVPRAFLSDDVCLDREEVLGDYVKLSCCLAKGSLFYKGALEEDIKDLSLTLLKENEVSYDLYTSEVKINTGNLSVNMCIDLYLSVKQSDQTLSDLLISDCRIIGLYDTQGRSIKAYEADARVAIVSIAVEEDYVALLNKALLIGNLNALSSARSYQIDHRSLLYEDSEILELLR